MPTTQPLTTITTTTTTSTTHKNHTDDLIDPCTNEISPSNVSSVDVMCNQPSASLSVVANGDGVSTSVTCFQKIQLVTVLTRYSLGKYF